MKNVPKTLIYYVCLFIFLILPSSKSFGLPVFETTSPLPFFACEAGRMGSGDATVKIRGGKLHLKFQVRCDEGNRFGGGRIEVYLDDGPGDESVEGYIEFGYSNSALAITGKKSPTLFFAGSCKGNIKPIGGRHQDKCNLWLMAVDNENLSEPDIFSILILHENRKEVYGTGTVVDGDIKIDPGSL